MKRLAFFCALFMAACLDCMTAMADGDCISFGGKEYRLDSRTILLDAEGIYDAPTAVKDPAEAFRMVNASGGKATLLVAPSVYWLDDPDDPEVRIDKGGTPFAVRLHCDSLAIIGLTEQPEDVVFAVNRGQTQGAVGNFTMFEFNGKDLSTENITFGNYCNTDLEYPRNPQLNRKKRKDAIVQAQIGICRGTDRLFARNCRFLSRLNLCPFVGAMRSLFMDCYFECTDDALAGSAIYLGCDFTFFSSKPFYGTDQTGAVFLNCDILSKCRDTQYFTKVPGIVTVIDTRFHSDCPLDIRWTRDASDVRCFQHNVTLNGRPYVIDSERPQLGPLLDGKPLMDAYRLDVDGKVYYNLPNLTNGDDRWDPAHMNEAVADIERKLGKQLTGIPVAMKVTACPDRLEAIGDTAVVTAAQLLWGGFPSGTVDSTIYVSDNSEPLLQRQIMRRSTPSGLEGAVTIEVEPKLRQAPTMKKEPRISYDEISGLYKVNYKLSGKGEDDSTIVWGRISDFGTDHSLTSLIKSGKGETASYYRAKAADCYERIAVAVIPKYKDSRPGKMIVSQPVEVSDPSRIAELPESALATTFADVPIIERRPGLPGTWCFDVFKPQDTAAAEWEAAPGSGWEYGKGYDASTGIGLIQNAKGARLSYMPMRDACRDMQATLTVEPAKSGGQGFGSATCQYMDICIKFNPVTLDGYALRIERTPDHDRAVRFSLIRYDIGKTSVIHPGVISNCYRTPCAITVGIKDGMMQASASTQAPATTPCCDETLPSVFFESPVADSGECGFCIQHTGSTGPSSTMIKDVKIQWD